MAEVHINTLGPDLHRHSRGNRVRISAFWTILLVFILLTIEGCAVAIVHFLLTTQSAYLLWRPNLIVASNSWKNSAAKVDEELGWPSAEAATSGTRDANGAKVNSDFADMDEPCFSAYGDSFVWGDDIPLQDGWIEQMSRRLKCRVANYGVSGYGTDQALLRFRRTGHDRAPVVILGVFGDNIVRNVNQYRAFIGFGLEPFWVKGRFVLDSSRNLQWIPRPKLDGSAFLELHKEPQAFLPNEHLLPDTRDGPVTVQFPYTLTLLRFAMAPRIWNRIRGQTPWADLYSPDHPSGAALLTIAIAKAFIREAESRGARAFVVMMPSAGSFRSLHRFGAADYAPFVKAMNADGVDIFDPLPALLSALGGQNYCNLYAQQAACQGHFGVAGSALLAEVVANELRSRHLVPTSDKLQ
jgi:hypothetical protein